MTEIRAQADAMMTVAASQLRPGMVLADGTVVAVVELLGSVVWIGAEDDPLHAQAKTFERDEEVEVIAPEYDF